MDSDTKLLYLQDPDRHCFEAEVVEIRSRDGASVAVLDETAFFPEGGGQPGDRGHIDDVPVVDTTLEGEVVLHHLAAKPPFGPGDRIVGRVDRLRRLDHARQHTAQHLISAAFLRELGADTLSFHLGREESTLDLDLHPSALDPGRLRRLEADVNELVMEDLPVRTRTADGPEVQGLRRETTEEIRGPLRLVSIGDGLDRSACCGTHVRSTGRIGPILFSGTSTVRGSLRLAYRAGTRAVAHHRRHQDVLAELKDLLEAAPPELPARVRSLLEERAGLAEDLRALDEALARVRAETLAGQLESARLLKVLWTQSEAPDADHPRRVAAHLPPDRPWLMLAGVDDGSQLRITLARSPALEMDLREGPQEAFRDAGGRGGGGPDLLRGALPKAHFDQLAQSLQAMVSDRGDS